jgi:hypothetical protein
MHASSHYERLRWALNRLRAMSPAEVGFRVGRKVQSAAERSGIGLARVPVPTDGRQGKPWVSELPLNFEVARYVAAADRVLAGRYDVFALRDVDLGFPPPWNTDPKTRIAAPVRFGKDLDYRNSAVVGDIKYLWEINRHLELVTLAQAWHLTHDERYAHGCRQLLGSWFEQCPYPLGVNWCVSLEHAVRLVNWAFAWFLLGAEQSILFAGASGQQFRARWLSCIYQHCHFIAHHWSRHSSANNHLLGEATGLLVGSLTWPAWAESGHWAERARRELMQAAHEQTFEDGVNKEQAIWYHHAVADMVLIGGLLARANGIELGEAYWRRLEAMLDFIASVMDVGGNVPAIGDADEGVLVRFVPADVAGGGVGKPAGSAPADTEVFRSLLATGAVLFNRADLRRKAMAFDDKTRWLLGDAAESRFLALDSCNATMPVRQRFESGGYFILGESFETEDEVRIVADAGPLGYLSIAAHGHADALAFTLSVSGRPMLVDPGTFAYHTQRRWRRYFKGTRAHNTVTVDGEDQSVFGGNFLWLRHAQSRVEAFERVHGADLLVASHDGYCRLSDPVRHRRTWRYEPAHLSITDELLCRGSHLIEIHWHFAPECTISLSDRSIHAVRDHVGLELHCPEGLTPSLVTGRDGGTAEGAHGGEGLGTGTRAASSAVPAGGDREGQEGPNEAPAPLGWYSAGFDRKVPATTVVFSGRIRGNSVFRSQIRLRRSGVGAQGSA